MIVDLLGLPPLASEHGADVDKLLLYVHALMGALFVGWLAYFIYVLFRFRASRNPKAHYIGVKSHASSYVEGAVAAVEGVLLIGFAIPLWAAAVDKFPSEDQSTVIRVIASQFNWSAHYPGPDGVFGEQDVRWLTDNPFGVNRLDSAALDDFSPTALNVITVPVNKPVIARITSKDVVHSFKLNALRVTQDAIPGMSIPTWFTPTKEGQYLILCAQLCGAGHALMKGFLNVVSEEEYENWAREQSLIVTAVESE
jgi:cytochrome c oxidase subunit II